MNNKKLNIIINCDNNESYNAISIKTDNKELLSFNTGDIIIDWLDCFLYLSHQLMYNILSIDILLYDFIARSKKFKFKKVKDSKFIENDTDDFDYEIIINEKHENVCDVVKYHTNYYRKIKLHTIL